METNSTEDPRDSIIDRVTRVLDILASIEADLPLVVSTTADPSDSGDCWDALDDIASVVTILVERFEINRVDPNYLHNDHPDPESDVPDPFWHD